MDPDDETKGASTASLATVPGATSDSTAEDKRTLTHEELVHAMRKIKADGKDASGDDKREEEIRNKFRSYEQLKKDLDSVKVGTWTLG